MKHSIFPTVLLHCFLVAAAFGQGQGGDIQTFELNPASPPVPALKYRLLIDPNEKRPGNAAVFYMRAALLSSQAHADLVDKAVDAHNSRNQAEFEKLAGQLSGTRVTFDELQMAAERAKCDWNTGLEERGFRALLPELNSMRNLANALSIQAAYQMERGSIDDSVATIRVMYEMGQNVAQGPILVSGLVGVGITRLADTRLIELMGRSDSPNLYWALAGLPRPIHDLRVSMRSERKGLPAMFPLLAKARSQELSALEWRQTMNDVSQEVAAALFPNKATAKRDFEEDLKPGGSALLVLPAAQTHYAQSRKMSADDVALLDSATVVAVYYFDQFQQLSDDIEKPLRLPYPQMLKSLKDMEGELEQMRAAAPANPFLPVIPSIDRAAETFARADREVAALTAVEALRSYAASHDGKLPEHLEDVTDTPVPVDPCTGQPFEYKLANETAVLSSRPPAADRLEYTIRIRK
jgi:hypothetical protein